MTDKASSSASVPAGGKPASRLGGLAVYGELRVIIMKMLGF